MNHLAETLGDGNSAAPDSDQSQVFDATVLFEDFVGQSHQRTFNLGAGHQLCFLGERRFADGILLDRHATSTSSSVVLNRKISRESNGSRSMNVLESSLERQEYRICVEFGSPATPQL